MPEISAQYSYNDFHPQKGFTAPALRMSCEVSAHILLYAL